MSKTKQWVALALVAVLGILAAGWVMVVSPRRATAADTRQQAAAADKATDLLRSQLSVLKSQAKDLPQEQAKLAAVAAKLPDNPGQPALLRALAAAADTANVSLITVAPGPIAPVVAATPAATSATATPPDTTMTAAAASPAATSTLLAMPISLNIAGGYFQIEQFVAALEDMPRAIRVTGLVLTPGADPLTPVPASTAGAAPATADGRVLTATVTGSAYLNPGAAATAVVAPAAASTK